MNDPIERLHQAIKDRAEARHRLFLCSQELSEVNKKIRSALADKDAADAIIKDLLFDTASCE